MDLKSCVSFRTSLEDAIRPSDTEAYAEVIIKWLKWPHFDKTEYRQFYIVEVTEASPDKNPSDRDKSSDCISICLPTHKNERIFYFFPAHALTFPIIGIVLGINQFFVAARLKP